MGYAARLTTTVFVALAVAVLVIAFASGDQARGQTVTDPTLTAEEERILQNIVRDTKAADARRAAKAQKVLTTTSRARLTGLSRVLITRGGLAGAAAGIWIHNGVTLYYGLQGVPEPKPLVLDAQFRKAEEGRAGGFFSNKESGKVMAAGAVLTISYSYDASQNRCTYSSEWVSTPYTGGWPPHGSGSYGIQPNWSTSTGCGYSKGVSAYSQGESGTFGGSSAGGGAGPSRFYQAYTHSQVDGASQPKEYFATFDSVEGGSWRNPVFDWGSTAELEPPPGYEPEPGDYVSTLGETKALVDAIEADPEYDPSWAKPWLREDFRAPSDPQQREALWGPAVGTWTTPGGGECKEFEGGAKLCDHPDGSTFAWIVKDYTAWMQHPGGDKEWRLRPGDVSGGGSGGGGPGGEGIPRPDARAIAIHAISNGHEIPNLDIDDPYNTDLYEEYVFQASRKNSIVGESQPANFAGPHVRTRDGARAWYDVARSTIIIHNPAAPDNKGTVYSAPSTLKDFENFPNSDVYPYEN